MLTPAVQLSVTEHQDSLKKKKKQIDVNWRDVFFRKGTFNSHDINGGTERTPVSSQSALR